MMMMMTTTTTTTMMTAMLMMMMIQCLGVLVGTRAGLDDFGEEENILALPEFEPRSVQSVA
jgi:hypothetical protein